jgi:hypothetical protein
MSTIKMSPQEAERVAVFQYAEHFPVVPPMGVVAVIVDPLTGAVLDYATGMDSCVHAIRAHGAIAYALADIAAPEELGDIDAYWTVERAQRFYDHHRAHYVNGD